MQDETQLQRAGHGLNEAYVLFFYPTFCKHIRGGKVAMTMALRHAPLDRLVVVDMAPVKVELSSEFTNYVAVMKDIQNAHVKKQSEADTVMKKAVNVSLWAYGPNPSFSFSSNCVLHLSTCAVAHCGCLQSAELGFGRTPVSADKPQEGCEGRWLQFSHSPRHSRSLA